KETQFFLKIKNHWLNQWVHPVQLYEAGWDALLLALIYKEGRKKEGRSTVIYFGGYALGRFFLEFLRGDNKPALLFLTIPQLTSIAIIIYFVLFLTKINNKNNL